MLQWYDLMISQFKRQWHAHTKCLVAYSEMKWQHSGLVWLKYCHKQMRERECKSERRIQGWRKIKQWGGLGKEKGLKGERWKGRVSVKSKRRGLNKASGPQKAELSDILINNRSSIKGRLIGQRQKDCSALTASPLRGDSTLWDRVRKKTVAETDRWMRRMTRSEGRTDIRQFCKSCFISVWEGGRQRKRER